jgi:glycosyltransferase involved in cell wall biosynthesis
MTVGLFAPGSADSASPKGARMTPLISIAMATYNGEKYLREQLKSLADQTYLPCELVVGDDGSTDGTIAILNEFSRRAPFPIRIIRNPENLGYGDNFLRTAAECTGDWIAFCDQDDVWSPKKLELCAEAIHRHPNLTLVLQNAELCDEYLNGRGRLLPNSIRPGIYEASQLYGLRGWNGFLQTVKSTLIRDVQFGDRPPDNTIGGRPVLSHDGWTFMIANVLGGVGVLGGSVALHRRHRNAVTDNRAKRSIRGIFDDIRGNGYPNCLLQCERAARSANILRQLASNAKNDDWACRFAKGASQFDRYCEIQKTRAQLWSDNIANRLQCYISLWSLGVYLGPPFIAMGWRNALKDAAVTLLGGKLRMVRER